MSDMRHRFGCNGDVMNKKTLNRREFGARTVLSGAGLGLLPSQGPN